MGAWRDGWFEVMDAGSQLIVEATEADAGEVVVDYCAGNGGKTLALASRMNRRRRRAQANNASSTVTNARFQDGEEGGTKYERSLIVAHDIVEERLRQIKGSLGRTGIACNSSGGDGNKNGTVDGS